MDRRMLRYIHMFDTSDRRTTLLPQNGIDRLTLCRILRFQKLIGAEISPQHVEF